MGVDEQSKGIWIYWLDKKPVHVEWNVHYRKMDGSASRLEEEINGIIKMKANDLSKASNSSTKSPSSPCMEMPAPSTPPCISSPPPASKSAPEELPTERCICKPSQCIVDLLKGHGHTFNHPSDPIMIHGIQTPIKVPNVIFEGEGQAQWMMAADFTEEYVLVAEISEAEALELCTLAKAKHHPDWPLWEEAIHKELETLHQAGTWELTEAPDSVNRVGSKWVFHVKKDAAGTVIWYKARLVVQGFSQVPSVDYFDMFAPIAKLAAIRLVLTMAATEDLELHQIDIKGTYLNGELTNQEIIYMQQSPGYH